MNAPLDLDWTTANQQLLVAEFARLRILLGDETAGDAATAQARIDAARSALPAPATIDTLAQLFGLSAFERDVLLLAAGVEMDARLAALCADATAQPQRPWATFGLALAALPAPHWSALAPVEALRRWRLVDLDERDGLTRSRLSVDERVLHFIGGLNYLDHRLRPLIAPVPRAGLMADAHRTTATRIAEALRNESARLPTIVLTGDDTDGQRDLAAWVAETLGVGLFALRAADIPTAVHERASLAALWQREAALLGAALLIRDADEAGDALARYIGQLDGLVFVAGRNVDSLPTETLRFTIDKSDAPGQRALWQAALGERGAPLKATLDALASQYRLGAAQIARHATRIDGAEPEQAGALLHRLCRGDGAAARGELATLAQPIDARATRDDLILPEAQRHTLEQIVMHTRHRLTVHHDWGFAAKGTRGLGIATLFAGESGTGKTLAAEVLAHELDLALYRIDLSSVVSKYIGETEKNLRKVFDAAEDIGAILLFDEADALFGKRSEVKDSHDRYANIETSYLLQRMEAYRGLAILTTNHKAALDTAFQRRLRFVVHFPFPDAAQREAIWRTVFPAKTPCDGLDCTKLARLNVTGGTIRNIALNAAFLAADAGTPVTMAHLLRATHLEAAKRERAPSDAETRGWS